MPGLNLTREEATERASIISSVTRYEISLDLTRGDTDFGSFTRIEFDAREGASTFADLVSTNVHSIRLNGNALDPFSVHQDNRIALENLAEHNVLEVDASCQYMHTGEGLHRFVDPADGQAYTYSQFEVPDARRVYTTFEQAHGLTKSEHIGAVTKVTDHIPPTSEVLEEKTKGFRKELPTLLFVGGSAGARVFNEFVTEHQAELLHHYNIINLTGDSTLNQAEGGLYRVDYVTDQYLPMLQKADLVVTRGGANTLFELLAMNKLHLIVPLGKEASRGDQIENAQYFVDKGYAEQLQEDRLTLETFNETIQEMLKQSQVYHQAMEKSTELLSLDDFYGLLQKDISKGKDDGRQ